ncbi:MAG: hypothetical protein ACE366_09420 [Bradymonadia bacterium]
MYPLIWPITLILAQLGGPLGSDKADPKALEGMAREALADVEFMRGQQLSAPLKMGVKTKPEVTKFIQRRFKEEYGPAYIEAEGRLLKMLGLMPADMKYGQFMTELLTEQVAGFYDHTRQELHIAAWLPAMMQGPVMAHEIFHAIQDQEWGGGKLIDSKKYSHDAVLAHAALLEGDATVVMFNYTQYVTQKQMGAQNGELPDISTSKFTIATMAAALASQMGGAAYPVMARAPKYMKQSLIFPYQQGLLFVAALRQAGWGWDKIKGVYADPPSSTEQVLHPERYHGTRDLPSDVTLEGDLLPGFTRGWDHVAGEFHWRAWLQSGLDQGKAEEGAAGWDGDRTVLLMKGADSVLASAQIWDAPEEAASFVKAAQAVHATRSGKKPAMKIAQRGDKVFMVLAHDSALADRAMTALEKQARFTKR